MLIHVLIDDLFNSELENKAQQNDGHKIDNSLCTFFHFTLSNTVFTIAIRISGDNADH